MRVILLSGICLLTISLSYSQDTLTARKERLLIENGDTNIVMHYQRAKTLFSQIAKLSEYKIKADSLLSIRDSTIENGKAKQSELKQAIGKLESIIENKDLEIGNLKQISKNRNRAWVKRVIYGTTGGAIVGLVAGILIVK